MQVAEQYEMLRGKKLRPAALIVGGLPERQQLSAIRAGARLVVATPGRLEDFIGRRLIDFRGLTTLVLDEADRMLDMGFVPSIRRIIAVIPRQRHTMCFSATLEASVAHLVNECMREPVRVALGSTLKPSNTVKLQAFEVSPEGKVEILQHLLSNESGRCLVFARTKRGTERLARRLIREGYAATMIHGDRSQSQRTAAMSGFQHGRFNVLVATDLAARGIHVDRIAHVINYDMPQIAEDFVHRVGRTGRAGDSGIASTLVTRSEMIDLHRLERSLNLHIERMRLENGELSRQPDERPRVRTQSPEYAQPAPLASERRRFGHRPRTVNLRNAIC
jgi:ATP-dependent RNA helicase RhlE